MTTSAHSQVTETAWNQMKKMQLHEVASLLDSYFGQDGPYRLHRDMVVHETFTGRNEAVVQVNSYRELVAWLLTIEAM